MGVFMTYQPSVSGASSGGLKHDWSDKRFGREAELAQLSEFLNNPQHPIAVIHAPAGMGKTTLVRTWLQRLTEQNDLDIETIYGWTLGMELPNDPEDLAGLEQLARCFLGFSSNTLSTSAKIAQLAVHFAQHKTLLVFDNVPSDIFQLNSSMPMPLDWLHKLLEYLWQDNAGLCVLITDALLPEDVTHDPKLGIIELKEMPAEDAKSFLLKSGVAGDEASLDRMLAQMNNHTLALSYGAHYLKHYHRGHVEGLNDLPIWKDNDVGYAARRVLAGFSIKLKNTPELALLYLLSFIRQSVRPQQLFECIDYLTRSCVKRTDISDHWFSFIRRTHSDEEDGVGLPEWFVPIRGIALRKLKSAHKSLEHLGLLANEVEAGSFELHSVARDYFFNELKTRYPSDWMDFYRMFYQKYHKELALLPLTETVVVNPFIRKSLTVDPLTLRTSIETAVKEKNWLDALRWSAQLSTVYTNSGDLAEAAACLRQCAAYARLGGDNAALRQSLQRLEELNHRAAA